MYSSKDRIVHLTLEEVMKLCKLGEGANTCIWLVMGSGWECLYYCRNKGRNLIGETLEERWRAGLTVAKRGGCEKIKEVNISTTNVT